MKKFPLSYCRTNTNISFKNPRMVFEVEAPKPTPKSTGTAEAPETKLARLTDQYKNKREDALTNCKKEIDDAEKKQPQNQQEIAALREKKTKIEETLDPYGKDILNNKTTDNKELALDTKLNIVQGRLIKLYAILGMDRDWDAPSGAEPKLAPAQPANAPAAQPTSAPKPAAKLASAPKKAPANPAAKPTEKAADAATEKGPDKALAKAPDIQMSVDNAKRQATLVLTNILKQYGEMTKEELGTQRLNQPGVLLQKISDDIKERDYSSAIQNSYETTIKTAATLNTDVSLAFNGKGLALNGGDNWVKELYKSKKIINGAEKSTKVEKQTAPNAFEARREIHKAINTIAKKYESENASNLSSMTEKDLAEKIRDDLTQAITAKSELDLTKVEWGKLPDRKLIFPDIKLAGVVITKAPDGKYDIQVEPNPVRVREIWANLPEGKKSSLSMTAAADSIRLQTARWDTDKTTDAQKDTLKAAKKEAQVALVEFFTKDTPQAEQKRAEIVTAYKEKINAEGGNVLTEDEATKIVAKQKEESDQAEKSAAEKAQAHTENEQYALGVQKYFDMAETDPSSPIAYLIKYINEGTIADMPSFNTALQYCFNNIAHQQKWPSLAGGEYPINIKGVEFKIKVPKVGSGIERVTLEAQPGNKEDLARILTSTSADKPFAQELRRQEKPPVDPLAGPSFDPFTTGLSQETLALAASMHKEQAPAVRDVASKPLSAAPSAQKAKQDESAKQAPTPNQESASSTPETADQNNKRSAKFVEQYMAGAGKDYLGTLINQGNIKDQESFNKAIDEIFSKATNVKDLQWLETGNGIPNQPITINGVKLSIKIPKTAGSELLSLQGSRRELAISLAKSYPDSPLAKSFDKEIDDQNPGVREKFNTIAKQTLESLNDLDQKEGFLDKDGGLSQKFKESFTSILLRDMAKDKIDISKIDRPISTEPIWFIHNEENHPFRVQIDHSGIKFV